MRNGYTLSGKKLPEDYQPSEYSIGIFLGLNRLAQQGKKGIYQGTAQSKRVSKNGERRKRQRYHHLELIARRANEVFRQEQRLRRTGRKTLR